MHLLLIFMEQNPSAQQWKTWLSVAQKQGHSLRLVCPNPIAESFNTPALSLGPFDHGHHATDHIEWARWPDIILLWDLSSFDVVRMSQGSSANFPLLIALATRAPLIGYLQSDCVTLPQKLPPVFNMTLFDAQQGKETLDHPDRFLRDYAASFTSKHPA